MCDWLGRRRRRFALRLAQKRSEGRPLAKVDVDGLGGLALVRVLLLVLGLGIDSFCELPSCRTCCSRWPRSSSSTSCSCCWARRRGRSRTSSPILLEGRRSWCATSSSTSYLPSIPAGPPCASTFPAAAAACTAPAFASSRSRAIIVNATRSMRKRRRSPARLDERNAPHTLGAVQNGAVPALLKCETHSHELMQTERAKEP